MGSKNYGASIQRSDKFNIEAELNKRNEFSRREVGLNHPDNHSFLRLNDDGDIEIFAAPGVGIVISASGRSISLFADSIRMFTKDDGLRWNNYNFNYSAYDYSQPTLVKIDYKSINSPQNNASYYLSKLDKITQKDNINTITIQGERGFGSQIEDKRINYSSEISLDGLTPEQITLVENVLKEYPKEYIIKVVDLLKQGYTFAQAQQKAEES
jgi:hypothetical protein